MICWFDNEKFRISVCNYLDSIAFTKFCENGRRCSTCILGEYEILKLNKAKQMTLQTGKVLILFNED